MEVASTLALLLHLLLLIFAVSVAAAADATPAAVQFFCNAVQDC